MEAGPTFPSAACDAVMAATHPLPEDGGPCATCAFRPGTAANQAPHTRQLVNLCVEGFREFHCHERPQLCRGFIAAINLRGVPASDDERKMAEVAGCAADVLYMAVDAAANDPISGGSGKDV